MEKFPFFCQAFWAEKLLFCQTLFGKNARFLFRRMILAKKSQFFFSTTSRLFPNESFSAGTFHFLVTRFCQLRNKGLFRRENSTQERESGADRAIPLPREKPP